MLNKLTITNGSAALIMLISCCGGFPSMLVAASSDYFISVPTTVKTFENDTVILPCKHQFPTKYTRWYFDQALIADSRQPGSLLPGYEILINGSLQVWNVSSESSGEYLCEVLTTEGVVDQTHYIEVQYPPTVVSEPSGVVEAKIGEIIEIFCEATGFPDPIITWRKHGMKMAPEGFVDSRKKMTFDVMSIDQAGPIECIANNGVGEPAVAGILLKVLFPPLVHPISSFVHTKMGLKALLECEVSSHPYSIVHWFHGTDPVNYDIRISRSDVDMNSNKTTASYFSHRKHILTIKNLRDADLGEYHCRAENELGANGAKIELAGRPRPSVFKQSPVASLPGTQELIWTTESLSPLIEYSLKFRKIPTGDVVPGRASYHHWKEITIPAELSEGPIHSVGYTLKGLDEGGSVYEVTVSSRNRYGWSDKSRSVRFHTGGEAIYSSFPPEIAEYGDVLETNYIDQQYNVPQHIRGAGQRCRIAIFTLLSPLLVLRIN